MVQRAFVMGEVGRVRWLLRVCSSEFGVGSSDSGVGVGGIELKPSDRPEVFLTPL
jgi:hypothetical protein